MDIIKICKSFKGVMKKMLKKKAIKIRGLICLLAIVLASKGWATQGTETAKAKNEPQLEEYVSKEILFLPWGTGKGEIGLKVEEMLVQGIATETVRYGPSKIEVDKIGNIFIFDEFNKQIYKYSKEKKRLSSISLSKVEKEPLLIERFKADYRYEFIKSKEPTAGAYKHSGEKEWIIGIKILDKTDKILGEIIFPPDPAIIVPFGFDKEGNIYLLIDTTDTRCAGFEDWRLEIYKYNKKGSFLAKIKLSTDIGYTSRFSGQKGRIKVDKDGNIYQLLPKKDGIHIFKWEMK